MKTTLLILAALALLCGCANGPTHDYYNPIIVGAHYPGPITILQVDLINAELEKCQHDGYKIIGVTRYTGSYPKTVELMAQAKRCGANHIVYHSGYMPPEPGSWSFSINRFGGGGGTDRGRSDNYIVFMGK